jgi:hypothetical protein
VAAIGLLNWSEFFSWVLWGKGFFFILYFDIIIFMKKADIQNLAIGYLKKHKNELFHKYLDHLVLLENKLAYFSAGPSGAGKTEFMEQFLLLEPNLLYLDIDEIRNFFSTVGYDGSNADFYQKPASWGVQFLFDEAVKKRDLSLVVDSNFSHFQTAKENMVKLLKKNYKIEIFYIYNDLEKCFLYTKKRESVTKRVVPEDIFFQSVINSRDTTYKTKELFGTDIVLNIVDKRSDSYYENVTSDQFLKIIPPYKEER